MGRGKSNDNLRYPLFVDQPPHPSRNMCSQRMSEIKQGNFEETKPSNALLSVLKEQLDHYVGKGMIVKMHCDVEPTACPGKHLVEWVENYKKGLI